MERSNLSAGERAASQSRMNSDGVDIVGNEPEDCVTEERGSSFGVGDVNSSDAAEALDSERSDDDVDSACGVVAVSQDTSLMRDMTSIADHEEDPNRTRHASREVVGEDVESRLEVRTAAGSGEYHTDDNRSGDGHPSDTLPCDDIHPDCAMQTMYTETTEDISTPSESDIDVAEITPTESDIGVAEITPESVIGVSEITTLESDIDVAEITPESDIDVTEITPESGIGVAEITPESGIDVTEITPESGIGVAELARPESDIGVAEITPESDIGVAEITPESDIDVAEITPESDIDVTEITPESGIGVAEIARPESDIGVAEITPESDIGVAEITPESDIDVAEITPESDIGVAELTPESGIGVAEITPESGIGVAEITPESGIGVAEITPESDIGVTEITPESDIDVTEITPESGFGVAEITPESDIGVTEITPESDIGVAEITPESDIDVTEITPESDIGVAEITPESDIGVAEITPESDIGVTEITPESDIGVAEITPESDIGVAEITPESNIGVAEITPESDIGVTEITTPESDIGVAEITPESDIGVAEITPESDIGVAEITPESDIGVAEITPESDIDVAEITQESDIGVAEITPESDIGVAEITPESGIGVAEITTESDIGVTEITPESDIGVAEITPESETCAGQTASTDGDDTCAEERSQTGDDTVSTQDVTLEVSNDQLRDEDESDTFSEYPATTASSDIVSSQGAEDYTDQIDSGHQHSGPSNYVSNDDVKPDTEGAFNDSRSTDMSKSVEHKETKSSFSDVFSEELSEGTVTTTDGDTIKTQEREKERCQEEEEESIQLAASVVVVDGRTTEHEESSVNYEGAESVSKESTTQEEITDADGTVVGRSQSKFTRHFRSSDSHSTSSSTTRTSSDESQPLDSDGRFTCDEFSSSQVDDDHSDDKHSDDKNRDTAFGEVIVLSDISEDDEYDVALIGDVETVPRGVTLRDGRKKGRHEIRMQEEAITDRDHCTAGRVKSVIAACGEKPEGRAGKSSSHTSTDDEGVFSQQEDDMAAGDSSDLNIHPQQLGESVAVEQAGGCSEDSNNLVRQQPYDKLGAVVVLCLPGPSNTEEGWMAERESRMMEGESRMMEGESRVMEVESRMTEGESTIVAGENRMADGESTSAEGESTIVDGESMSAEGESRVMAGEGGMSDSGLSSSQLDGQEELQELGNVAGQGHTGQHATSDNLTCPLLPESESNGSETASDAVEVCTKTTCESSDSRSTEVTAVTQRQLPDVDGDSLRKVLQSDEKCKEMVVTNSSVGEGVETMTGGDNTGTDEVNEEDIGDIPGQEHQDITQEGVAGLGREMEPGCDDLKQMERQQSTVAQDDSTDVVSPDKVTDDTLVDEPEECPHSPVDSPQIDTGDISDDSPGGSSVVVDDYSEGMHYDNSGVSQLNPGDTALTDPASEMMQDAGDEYEEVVDTSSGENSDSESEKSGTSSGVAISCPVDEGKSNEDTETKISGELSSGEKNEPVVVCTRKAGGSLEDDSHFGESDGFVGKPDDGRCLKTEKSTSGASRRVSRRDVHDAMRTLKQVGEGRIHCVFTCSIALL